MMPDVDIIKQFNSIKSIIQPRFQ